MEDTGTSSEDIPVPVVKNIVKHDQYRYFMVCNVPVYNTSRWLWNVSVPVP
jgi:hypothetical protein